MECSGNVVVRACGDASGNGSALGIRSLWVREWSGRALDTAPISRGEGRPCAGKNFSF